MTNRSIMLQAFDDFMSAKVLLVSLISFFITVSIIFSSLYLIFDNVVELKDILPTAFNHAVEWIFQKLENYSFLSFILEHKLVMAGFHILVYFGLGIVLYYLFFTIYAFVISFFNTMLIKYIQKKYYPDIELRGINMISTLVFYVKTIIIALILFIILSPAYIIPAVNILIFLPIYYFFHKTIVFDVSSVINTSKEYRKLKRVNWAELKTKTGFCFVLTLIPIVGIFLYPYYVLYLGHYFMEETKELRYSNDFHGMNQ